MPLKDNFNFAQNGRSGIVMLIDGSFHIILKEKENHGVKLETGFARGL